MNSGVALIRRWRAQFAPAGAPRRVLSLAWPSVLEQSLLALVALVDTFIVGHLGAPAIASVGLGGQILQLGNAVLVAVGVGATALVAREIGARRPAEASALGRQALLIGLGVGGLMAVIALVLPEAIFRLLGGDEEVVRLGSTWLRLVAPSFIFTALLVTGGATLRGAGEMRATLMAISVVNVVNVVLAWSLTRGAFGLPRLGVAGTGLGTSVGQISGGLVILAILIRGRGGLRPFANLNSLPTGASRVRDFCNNLACAMRPDWVRIRRILNVGLPAGAEQLMLQIALFNMFAIVTRLSTNALAAHVITLRLTALSYLPGYGFSVAATTLVGQELGARRPDRASAAVYAALAMSVSLMSVAAVGIFVFDAVILRFFTSDASVVAAGVPIMRLAAVIQPLIATAFVFGGALRGAGDTRATMVVTLCSVWGLRLLLAYLFAVVLGIGLIGVWLAFIADWISRALFFWLRFRAGRWQAITV